MLKFVAPVLALLTLQPTPVFALGYQFSQTPAPSGAVLPVLVEPANGATLSSLSPLLRWNNPGGATQYELQIVPFSGDGPGVDLHVGSADAAFQVPAPPQWYGLLPDMTYTWRVRTAAARAFLSLSDPQWGPWAEARFHTPATSSATIRLQSPASGAVSTTTPTLKWTDSRNDVYYYEVQLSKDPGFNGDPRTAIAPLYWVAVHGGLSNPHNSYTIPPGSRLEAGATYYWRVRPRIQGDGRPVAWTAAAKFVTATAAGSLETQALELINQQRAQQGLGTLTAQPQLTAAAQAHSDDMASSLLMSHQGTNGSDPGSRISAAGYGWRVYGEIVAAGYATADSVVAAWMNSPSHKQVILLPSVTEFGVGLAYGADGRAYWTVDFGAPR